MLGTAEQALGSRMPADPGESHHPAPGGQRSRPASRARRDLYTPEQKARRDNSTWTRVQAILAPVQFGIFLVSLVLVARYLQTGQGAFAADASIVAKTLALYTIMVTGAIWEKVVFGKYLFAEAFFWEDVVSMLVIALHTAYLVMLAGAFGTTEQRMFVALAGYGAYVINAGQFILKLRSARLQAGRAAGNARLAALGNGPNGRPRSRSVAPVAAGPGVRGDLARGQGQ